MGNALPGAEAVKEERDVEEVTPKLETESEEESLAALPVFQVPFADLHNDPPQESLRQQAEEVMKLFEFVHHSIDKDQVQIELTGDAPYQSTVMDRSKSRSLPQSQTIFHEQKGYRNS